MFQPKKSVGGRTLCRHETAPRPLVLALLLCGCANPGPPKPPSLHLPKPAQALSAERVGGRVVLTWTVEADTTDGGKMRPPLTASVCRGEVSSPHAGCLEVGRIPVQPGAVTEPDALPASLEAGPPRLLEYRVELFNAQGRSAGKSDAVYAAAGEAPGRIGSLSVTPRRNAALVAWGSREVGDEVRIVRKLLATSAGPLAVRTGKKQSEKRPESQMPGKTLKEATLTSGPINGHDPGGMIDRGIHDGDTVTYRAQRVRTVSLTVPATTVATKKNGGRMASPSPNGTKQVAASTRVFELHGEPSPTVTFVFHDTQPPSVPTGLAAIPGGGFGQPPSIDLSWESNAEEDVAGYNVYRAEAGQDFVRLNDEPVEGSSYRDLTVQPGHSYRYRVTAVDQRHRESLPSGEVVEQFTP